MFSFVYNTGSDFNKDNYDLKKAAEHIVKITQNNGKDSDKKK